MARCPVQDCTRQKPLTGIFCRSHWFQLPKELRTRIWQSYRSPDKYVEERQQAWTKRHRALVREALETSRALNTPKTQTAPSTEP